MYGLMFILYLISSILFIAGFFYVVIVFFRRDRQINDPESHPTHITRTTTVKPEHFDRVSENSVCVICKDNTSEIPVYSAKCDPSHTYHLDCFEKWYSRNPTQNSKCLLCESPIVKSQ